MYLIVILRPYLIKMSRHNRRKIISQYTSNTSNKHSLSRVRHNMRVSVYLGI